MTGAATAGAARQVVVPGTGPILHIDDLAVAFPRHGTLPIALDGVSLEVSRGEVLALVGETGCGKSLSGLSALGLLPPGARVLRGSVTVDGDDVLSMSANDLRRLRGRRVGMIFQSPTTAFNPVFPVGRQIEQVIRQQFGVSSGEARRRVRDGLADVSLPDPERIARAYPHELSGGMLQRAMIAMALACEPDLLVADEPTTALDVTIAAGVVRLLQRLQAERGFSILFISHSLATVATIADRIAVLYAGRVIETAATATLFAEPHHPYTRALLQADPGRGRPGEPLAAIGGVVPADPGRVPGCTFAPRCTFAIDACRTERPPLRRVGEGHRSACIRDVGGPG